MRFLNWYFQSTLKALSVPRINAFLGEWNQQHGEKWWPFWFSNKHFSEGPSKSSRDFMVIHSNATHLYKYQYLSFFLKAHIFQRKPSETPISHLHTSIALSWLIKMVPGRPRKTERKGVTHTPRHFSTLASFFFSSPRIKWRLVWGSRRLSGDIRRGRTRWRCQGN